jgi:hypothetical protein
MNAIQALVHSQKKTDGSFAIGGKNMIRSAIGACQFPAKELGFTMRGAAAIDARCGHIGFISADDIRGEANFTEKASVNPCDTLAKTANLIQLMADQDNRPAGARDISHFPETLALKFDVPDGKHFIDQQDFRFEVRRNRKG